MEEDFPNRVPATRRREEKKKLSFIVQHAGDVLFTSQSYQMTLFSAQLVPDFLKWNKTI